MSHVSLPSGTLLPIIKGNNLSKAEFSCPFPPILSLATKVFVAYQSCQNADTEMCKSLCSDIQA